MDDPIIFTLGDPNNAYVIVRDRQRGFSLINIKEKSMQLLVSARCETQGFCIALDDYAFDFHFVSHREEEDNALYEYHHRL